MLATALETNLAILIVAGLPALSDVIRFIIIQWLHLKIAVVTELNLHILQVYGFNRVTQQFHCTSFGA